MPTFLLYCLKAAGCLVVFYLFYKLLLSRDTLHRMNRVLLCGVLLLSMLLPVCVITIERELPRIPVSETPAVPESYPQQELTFRMGETEMPSLIIEEPEPLPEPFDWVLLFGIGYFTGLLVTLGWTVRNIVQVVRMTRRGRRIPLGNGRVLVLSDRACAPFSWMKYVVMSEEDYARGAEAILVHEQAHLKLGHSWDLLLIDLLGCLQWFNPAMWLLRAELRAVHEYEADEQVLRCGVDAKDYQMLLIRKAVGGRWYSVANSLNHSNLKNRITMMLRKRSSGWARAKALYVLPLACLALGAFAQTSYVLPKDKTTKNSGNDETSLTMDTVGLTADTVLSDKTQAMPGVSSPEAIDGVVDLLKNLEQAALRAKSDTPTVPMLTGRVFGAGDKPLSGFEFRCSGGDRDRIMTDAEGRFSLSGPVQCYIFDKNGFAGMFTLLNRVDANADFHLKESVEVHYSLTGNEPVVYAAFGDPEGFRFDRDHLPLLMYYDSELSPEMLQDLMSVPGKKSVVAWASKDPSLKKLYGEKSANGVISISIENYPRKMSWSPADPSTWNPDDVELYLVWNGELSDELLTRFEQAEALDFAHFREKFEKNPSASVAESIQVSGDGQITTVILRQTDVNRPIPTFDPADKKFYVLDGKEVNANTLSQRAARDFASVTLLKRAAAVKKYGQKGRAGAIELTSRPQPKQSVATPAPKADPFQYLTGNFKSVDGRNTYKVRNIGLRTGGSWDSGHLPLVLWNGRVSNIHVFSNNHVDRDIETIQIISDPDAATIARYGSAARNGVIRVVTKELKGDREKTIYDRSNHPFRYLRGRMVSIDGRNTYKVSNLSLRNVLETDPDSLPLVVVDDRVVSITALGDLSARKIETLQVFDSQKQGNDLVIRYGRKARNGVIKITTKNSSDNKVGEYHAVSIMFPSDATGATTDKMTVMLAPGASGKHTSVETMSASAEPLENVVTMTYTDEDNSLAVAGDSLKEVGLMILNGEEISAERLSQLNPAEIDAITVLKGKQAIERYGEKGAKGVIEITTKKSGERKFKRIGCAFINGSSYKIGPGLWRIKDTGFGFSISPQDGTHPLVMVDGELVDLSYLDDIDADAVATVQVVQPSAELVAQYGEQGYDGMIRFITKAGRKQEKKIEAERRKAARAGNEKRSSNS